MTAGPPRSIVLSSFPIAGLLIQLDARTRVQEDYDLAARSCWRIKD
jgi:hypothetical protein